MRLALIGQLLISFREALEAALITAIVLGYLSRTNRKQFLRYVWHGVFLAVAASLVVGAIIWLSYGVIPKIAQLLFEGIAAIIAVIVLTSMIFWMARKAVNIKEEMEQRIEAIVSRGAIFGLISFSFIIVFREGLETVLFLTPPLIADAVPTIAGAAIGVALALTLSYAVFVVGKKISLRKFFYFTSILLILLAGGLAGYGVHELIEFNEKAGGSVGWLGDYAYDLGIPESNPFHHKGIIGSIFAVMFGYTIKAEWARVIVHLAYLAVALPLVVLAYRKKSSKNL